MAIQRELMTDGAIRLSAGDATFVFRRLRPGALLVTVSGVDHGQFGPSPLDEISQALQRDGQLELFVDARAAVRASVSVSEEWTHFFGVQRAKLRRVHVLAVSRTLQLTVAIVQHLSRTGNLIEIYAEPSAFEARVIGNSA